MTKILKKKKEKKKKRNEGANYWEYWKLEHIISSSGFLLSGSGALFGKEINLRNTMVNDCPQEAADVASFSH